MGGMDSHSPEPFADSMRMSSSTPTARLGEGPTSKEARVCVIQATVGSAATHVRARVRVLIHGASKDWLPVWRFDVHTNDTADSPDVRYSMLL